MATKKACIRTVDTIKASKDLTTGNSIFKLKEYMNMPETPPTLATNQVIIITCKQKEEGLE